MSPRINVEEDLFGDRRWMSLVKKLGDEEKALGALVFAWKKGQEYWKACNNGIPKSVWKSQGLNDAIIEVGLAIDTGDFVKIHNSEKHFAWLRQKSEAGVNGAKVTNELRWGAKNETPETMDDSCRQASSEVAGDRRESPSSSSSLSSSSSFSGSGSRKKNSSAPDGFEEAFSEYKANFATAQRGGQAAHSRFRAEITSEEKLHDLHQAIRHYAAFLEHPDNSWRHAKTTFANFLGTERSGFFWREWVQAPALTPATAPRANGRGQSRTHMNESVLENVERRLKAEAAQEIHE
jgi:hypothetical protein